MADQPQPGTISAAFPAPPPFYKSFTPQNLKLLQEHLEPSNQPTTPAAQPTTAPVADLLSLPPELRNLVPPLPPAEGKYRSFGTLHEISSTSASEDQHTPTPSRLLSLTHKLLLTFLSLTNALATNPSGYGPIWDELHELFQQIHHVINGYRPHQARETLILMLEEQLERVRAETKGVGEAVERAKEVVKTLGKEDQGVRQGGATDRLRQHVSQGSMKAQDVDRRIWKVLEREAIGPAEGKGVIYALISTTPTTFAWSVGLEDIDADPTPIDRYLVKIDRQSKEILPPEPIMLLETELAEAIFAATGQHLASSSRFTDGLLSTSYKVTVQHSPDVAYVVQLRHHGRVASMDFLMSLISGTIDPHILPVPPVYPIPGEMERQEATGMGRQITRLIPGDMVSAVYPRLSHEERLVLVQKVALAFQACWQIQLPQLHLIGELLGDETNGLTIGPDRHYNLGGPFITVRGYLRAYIRSSFSALVKQQGIDEYKGQYLCRIGEFIDRHEYDIPAVVEDIPIVAMHADMGLHNIILSSQTSTEIRAIIDWELVASAPYASLYRIIETLFRKPAPNQFGPEFDRANELREAFWDTIPYWKRWNHSVATQTFLEWFRFGLFMKPEPRPNNLPEDEKQNFWQENIRVVERILSQY